MYISHIDIFIGPIKPPIWSLPDWEVFPYIYMLPNVLWTDLPLSFRAHTNLHVNMKASHYLLQSLCQSMYLENKGILTFWVIV